MLHQYIATVFLFVLLRQLRGDLPSNPGPDFGRCSREERRLQACPAAVEQGSGSESSASCTRWRPRRGWPMLYVAAAASAQARELRGRDGAGEVLARAREDGRAGRRAGRPGSEVD
jgi:hypothetical protein